MKYADAVVRSTRLTVRNPFAIVLVSLGTTVSVLPFVSGVLLAGPVGGLIGLWTTSFMLGFVAVGGARIMTVTLEREVSLGTDYFWEGVRNGKRMGPVIGFGTFVVGVLVITLFSIPGSGVVGLSVSLLGVYLLLAWIVLVICVLTLWAALENSRPIRAAFVDGGTLILEQPAAAGWVLVQAIGWTLLAVPLIIAPMIVLPGFVQLVGTGIVRIAATESSAHTSVVGSDAD